MLRITFTLTKIIGKIFLCYIMLSCLFPVKKDCYAAEADYGLYLDQKTHTLRAARAARHQLIAWSLWLGGHHIPEPHGHLSDP